jgi:hypothetical protein
LPLWRRQDRPLILLYNRFFGRLPDTRVARECGCRVTTNRGLLPHADLVWMHLPELAPDEVPPKRPGQIWAGQWHECEAATPLLRDPAFMRLIDVTISHRPGSTIWKPYFERATAASLRRPPVPKTESAPAVCFVSGRYDWCRRTEYLIALMARLPVDSYGHVFRNRRLPGLDRGRATKLEVIARYKFTLAFENSIETDYVSEKLFDPLMAGSVPVYRGAPNVAGFAPAAHCYIDAADFSGPAALAEYLLHLAADDEAYTRHLAWKQADPRPGFVEMAERSCQDDAELFGSLCHMLS